VGKLRDLGLAALAFWLLSGPGAKVIAEDSVKPKKQAQEIVEVVKKEKKKEIPWQGHVGFKLNEHVSSEYDSVVAKNLRAIVTSDGRAQARAVINGTDYTFKETDLGVTATLRTKNRLIILNNHDKKEGFEDSSWINLDSPEVIWENNLPQRKDDPADGKKDFYPDGKERGYPGEQYEQELRTVLLVDSARELMQKFNSTLTDIDFNLYDAIMDDIVSTNNYCRNHLFELSLCYSDFSSMLIQPLPKRFFLNSFIKGIRDCKPKDWPEPLVCECFAKQGKKASVVFRVDKKEQGESYHIFIRTEKDKNSDSIEYVLHPNNEITITRKFSRTPKIKDKSSLITAVVKYTPKEDGGVLEHTNIGLGNAKRLLDFMNPIFQNLRSIYTAHKK
jgi:hypothetical protein